MGYFTNIINDGYNVTIEVIEGKQPYIGSNGNWWIDGVDTGKPSIVDLNTLVIDGGNSFGGDTEVIDGGNSFN